MNTGVVLLSGGLDSLVALYKFHEAARGLPDVNAVWLDYGQTHGVSEAKRSAELAHILGIPWRTLDVKSVMEGCRSPLLGEGPIPDISYDEIEGLSPMYVPYRNGILLSIAASLALQLDKTNVIIGVHAGDHAAYPDCTPGFITAQNSAIWFGTNKRCVIYAPLLYMSKAQIVFEGSRLGAPLEKTWSCYKGGATQCGTCPTCRERRAAFVQSGIEDKTLYMETP